MRRKWWAAALGIVALSVAPVRPGTALSITESKPPLAPAEFTGELRVMTYNVKGLPWPIAAGRPERLARIGEDLAAMRRAGRQPQVLLLQEAFIDEAKAIGMAGGYRYVAWGPSAATSASPQVPTLGAAFSGAAARLKGEGMGKVLDAGIVIFSDFPITGSAAMAFPADACAGFDCLAAKGVMIARINLPGQREALTIVNTHLNSDVSSSGVDEVRTDAAFAWQFAEARRFAAARIPAGAPAIFGGDFNIGPSARRQAAAERIGAPLPGAREALGDALDRSAIPFGVRAAARTIQAKHIDRMFYRSGVGTTLALARLDVPFTTDAPDSLSDHAAFTVTYNLTP